MNAPKARKDQLIVRELPGETLVYDENTGKAHCLNGTAAQVWKLCDGTITPEQMVRKLTADMDPDQSKAVVRLALEQLSRRDLLEDAIRPLSDQARLNRREVLRGLAKSAVVAAALPLIMTMASKTGRAAGASSCTATCTYNNAGTTLLSESSSICKRGICLYTCPTRRPAGTVGNTAVIVGGCIGVS